MKCFLDMDGVLVNFCDGAHKLHGVESRYPEWPWTYGPDGWTDIFNGLTASEFFSPMDRKFWSELEWHEDGKDILKSWESIVGEENICILTSPCLTEGCVPGKLDWIKREIPKYSKRVLFGSCKEFCARPDAILIDDNDENVSKFIANGGEANLVPRPWNSLWEEWKCQTL